MKVILDASVIIDHLRQPNKQNTFLARISFESEGVISLVTVAEVYSGKKVQVPGKQQDDLRIIFAGTEIVIPEKTTAMTVGLLRARYAMSLGDAFIAALAMERDLSIATLNDKDFRKIKEVRLYEFKAKK
ncbi:PIN domain-containing protein [Candidatus Gottesmanbacteria bacterium]|nr:PIN domain-containing protein [Candidatus Gottesmanbacteria bacterium]